MHTRERVLPVTVRVSTLKGAAAGLYYVEATGRYYVDSGEARGLWHGRGAELLGLAGEVDDKSFLALMAGRHPATGELLGRRYGEGLVRGFDVTASAPKSVSVLFALADEATRRSVLDAHDAAVAAMVGWVEAHAHTRFRIDGEVMTLDAKGIVVATFRQHTSRALDPQLHTHVVIANRVASPDGRWLALDGRTVKVDQRALSAIYHAGLRAELTRSLGVAWQQPVNGIAELVGVPERLREEFSSRTRAVQDRIALKLERFAQTFQRPPTPRERWRLEREAVTDSRPAKRHGLDAVFLHDEWAERAGAIGLVPQRVVADAVGRTMGERSLRPDAVARRALAALADKQSAWRPAELVRELAAAVPTDHVAPAADLVPSLDHLAAEVERGWLVDLSPAVPIEMPLRRDGRPITESALDRALTTPAILAQEEDLVAWADRRRASGGFDAVLDRSAVSHLSGPQREVAAGVAGSRPLLLVVGPAGTGKTTALAPAVAYLRAQGRPVFGVAPSAAAAEVLATEAGVPADTLDKLLVEHRLSRVPGPRFDLPSGATVIVDEAAMVSTEKLAELGALADERGWRLALVGDPLQFSAVGRSGMFAHLVQTCDAIELDRVRRFAASWERTASLALRRGEPDVLAAYEAHGRLHEGTRGQMEAAVVAAWRRAREAGERAAMMAPTNDTVVRLNQRAQDERIWARELDAGRPSVSAGPYRVLPGDEVATRRNDRELLTDRGLMIKNRDRWVVGTVRRDGSLTVSGKTGTITLPPAYVAEHVELAYAQTSHANQGRTVDRSLLLLDGPTDSRGVYVPLTRGRLTNEAFVVTEGEDTARDVLARALVSDWIDRPAVARRAELQRSVGLDWTELRKILTRRFAIEREMEKARFTRSTDGSERKSENSRRKQLQRALTEAEMRCSAAGAVLGERGSPLRWRQHAAAVAKARGELSRAEAAIGRDRAELSKVEMRIAKLDRSIALAEATLSPSGPLAHELHGIDGRLARDRDARARTLGAEPPRHVVERIGRRPASGPLMDRWDEAAARIDQHNTAFGSERASRSAATRRTPWTETAAELNEREVTRAVEELRPPPVRARVLDRGSTLESTSDGSLTHGGCSGARSARSAGSACSERQQGSVSTSTPATSECPHE